MKWAAIFTLLVTASASTISRASVLQQQTSLESALTSQIHNTAFLEENAKDLDKLPINLVVEWADESHLSLSVQYLFASTWIITLAMLPLILPIMDKRPPTRTQFIVGASMLVVLFGGVFLFTNIILFQSVHFKRVRPLTVVECIYFMAQIITTVGYGDITPAKTRGQVFVGMYVIGALFLIAMVISDLTAHMCKMAKDYKEQQQRENASDEDEENALKHMFAAERPSAKPLLTAIAIFAVIDFCWVCFFAMSPGEGKTWLQALYMSVVTLSTVGFGWFTPVTEAGMIFGAFFMLFGSAALVNVISEFTAWCFKMHTYDMARNESKCEALEELKSVVKPGCQDVSELQFLSFGLVHLKSVTPDDIAKILKAFETLKPQGGKVPMSAVTECVSAEYKDTPRSSARRSARN